MAVAWLMVLCTLVAGSDAHRQVTTVSSRIGSAPGRDTGLRTWRCLPIDAGPLLRSFTDRLVQSDGRWAGVNRPLLRAGGRGRPTRMRRGWREDGGYTRPVVRAPEHDGGKCGTRSGGLRCGAWLAGA
jgi:hypothetical protein